MYLSRLHVNVGDDPDRPVWGISRRWLGNLYHVHQRLCMAFPSPARQQRDPQFLDPWDPSDFPEQRHLADQSPAQVGPDELRHVHTRRGDQTGFLFRIDPQPGGGADILVQSALLPDWDYAFCNAGHLLAPAVGCRPPVECRQYAPTFAGGESLRFRLVGNPTKRCREGSLERSGEAIDQKWVGKRIPVPTEQLQEWLDRRAGPAGFAVDWEGTEMQPGYVYFNKERTGSGHCLRSVRFDGHFQVTDSARLIEAVRTGIGPAKAFGFGLLSLARAG